MFERLVAYGGRGVSVRQLGGNRAGEMRITRFLHNPNVTADEMMATASARTCAQVAGRHVLVIQDTSALRVDEKGVGLLFHPLLVVDANEGAVLGPLDNFFLTRKGGERATRKKRNFEDKDSRRWLRGAESAALWSRPERAALPWSRIGKAISMKASPSNLPMLKNWCARLRIVGWPTARVFLPKPMRGTKPATWRSNGLLHRAAKLAQPDFTCGLARSRSCGPRTAKRASSCPKASR